MNKMKKSIAILCVLLSCLTATAVNLGPQSPVGTVGVINGREGVVVELNGIKVAIATRNVGAVRNEDYGIYYSFFGASDEEFLGLTDGWYVPDKDELTALAANLTWDGLQQGLVWQVTPETELFLPAAGYINLNEEKVSAGSMATCWSSTAETERIAYRLSGTESKVACSGTLRSYLMPVRPFCRLEAATLSAESNVGDTGMWDGREAVVVDINGKKVAIATRNVGATDTYGEESYGSYFQWEDANDITKNSLEGSSWRVPRSNEYRAIIDQLKDEYLVNTDEKKGLEWPVTPTTTLFFPAAGLWSYGNENVWYSGVQGRYWTSDYMQDFWYGTMGIDFLLCLNDQGDRGQFRMESTTSGFGASLRPFSDLPKAKPLEAVLKDGEQVNEGSDLAVVIDVLNQLNELQIDMHLPTGDVYKKLYQKEGVLERRLDLG